MKHSLLLSVLSMGLLTACSTAFKAGQTPDDVYYSPGREMAAVVKAQENQKEQDAAYQEYVSSLDDRYLRMKIANRYRWGALDNFDYWYDSRYDFGAYNYNSYYYNSLNPYAYWNPGWNLGIGYGRMYPGSGGWGWSSPVYTVIHYTNPKYSGGGSVSTSNITAFRNKNYNNSNYNFSNPKAGGYTPPNSSSFGNLLKRVFTGGSENTSSSSFDRPVRTFTPAPNNTTPPASSSAGGNSGGFPSTGSSTSTGRGGRGG